MSGKCLILSHPSPRLGPIRRCSFVVLFKTPARPCFVRMLSNVHISFNTLAVHCLMLTQYAVCRIKNKYDDLIQNTVYFEMFGQKCIPSYIFIYRPYFEIVPSTNETKGGWCSIFNIRSLLVDHVYFKKKCKFVAENNYFELKLVNMRFILPCKCRSQLHFNDQCKKKQSSTIHFKIQSNFVWSINYKSR